MVLASLSDAAFWAVIGGYVTVIAVAYLLFRKDVYGRKRARGCIFGVALLGLGLVLAFAAWAADAIF